MPIQSTSTPRLARDAAAALQFQLRSRWSISKDGRKPPCMNAQHLASSSNKIVTQRSIHAIRLPSQTTNGASPNSETSGSDLGHHRTQRRLASTVSNNGIPKVSGQVQARTASVPPSRLQPQSAPAPALTATINPVPTPPSTPESPIVEVDVPILLFRNSGLKYPTPMWQSTTPTRDPAVWYDLWEKHGLANASRSYQIFHKVVHMFPPTVQKRINATVERYPNLLERCMQYGLIRGIRKTIYAHLTRGARVEGSRERRRIPLRQVLARLPLGKWIVRLPDSGLWALFAVFLLTWMVAAPPLPHVEEARRKSRRTSRERGQLPVDVAVDGGGGAAAGGKVAGQETSVAGEVGQLSSVVAAASNG